MSDELKKTLSTLEDQNKTLLDNYKQLDGRFKATMDELTALKNTQADAAVIMRQMQKLQGQLALERRAAFGSAIQRISGDATLRRSFVIKVIDGLKLWELMSSEKKDYWEGVKKDLDTANTPGSTYIANNELESELYDALLTFGAYRTLNVRQISAKAVDIRLKTARPVALFVDEAAAIGADASKAGSKSTLTPKKIATLLSISSELIEDDVAGVVQDTLNDIMEAIAFRADHVSFNGSGVANNTNGGFTGMFNGATAVTADATRTTIALTKYTDWLKCLTGVDPAVLQRQARWWLHPTLLAAAIGVKDDNGRPIFQTAIEAPSFGAIGTILGYPVTLVGAAPSTNAASAKVACFGDPNAYAVRIRRGIDFARSDDFAFDTDEITFRGSMRGAFALRLATAITVLTLPAA